MEDLICMHCPKHICTMWWDENEAEWYCWQCGQWWGNPTGEKYLGNGRWNPNPPDTQEKNPTIKMAKQIIEDLDREMK